jgi:hypothetical protein
MDIIRASAVELSSKELELATKDNSHIKNRIGTKGRNQQMIAHYINLPAKYPRALVRSANTDMYNCHGLVFASRRTNIDDPIEVKRILDRDEYDEINIDFVLPGDIIIYYSDDGDAEHSGIVIEKSEKPFNIPRVISKWGQLEEYIHFANDCQYNFANVKYYRIRI